MHLSMNDFWIRMNLEVMLYTHMQIHAEHNDNDNDDKAMKTSDTVF